MRSVKKRPRRDVEEIPVQRSSGNVFEDLGVPDSAGMLAKADLAARVAVLGFDEKALARRRLT